MTNNQIAFMLIAISLVISIVYILYAFIKKSKEMIIKGFIMFLCPPAGTVYYLGQYLMSKILKQDGEINLDEVGFSKERHNRILSPDVESELQLVPLEEIFIVSDYAEKRKRLLLELKKEYITNYGSIIKALDNDDAETSHYAASAITNAKAGFENDIRAFDIIYDKNNTDLALVRDYSDYVLKYINSGILDAVEARKYRYLYINLLTGVKTPEDFLTEQDYSNFVTQAVLVGEMITAEKWAEYSHRMYPGESSYLSILMVYYYTNKIERFFTTLDELKKSDIMLSSKGLSLVRFFMKANYVVSGGI